MDEWSQILGIVTVDPEPAPIDVEALRESPAGNQRPPADPPLVAAPDELPG